MKTLFGILLTLLLLISYSGRGQGLFEEWAFNAGGYGNDKGQAVATDHQGNVYIGGQFSSPAFSIGSNYVFQNAGGSDGFLAKINSSGDVVWAKQFGTAGNEGITAINVTPGGSILVAGQGMLLTKLSNNGNFIWQAGSAGGGDKIEIDPSGNIYAGSYSGFTKFRSDGTMLYSRGVPPYREGGGFSVDRDGNPHVVFFANGGTVTDGIQTFPVNLSTKVVYDSTGRIILVQQMSSNPRWYPTGYKALFINDSYQTAYYPTLINNWYMGFGRNLNGGWGYNNCLSKVPVNPETDGLGNEFYAASLSVGGWCSGPTPYPALNMGISGQIDSIRGNDIFYLFGPMSGGQGNSTWKNGNTSEYPARIAVDSTEKALYIVGYWDKLTDTSRFRFGSSELINWGNGTDVLLLKFRYNATPLTLNIGPDKAICKGASAIIGAEATGGAGGYTYQWVPSIGLNSTSIARPVAKPDTTTTYVVMVTDAAGTVKRDTITLTVDSTLYRPTVSVSFGTIPFCPGSSAVLTSSEGTSFQWNQGQPYQINTRSIMVTEAGRYWVRTVSPEGCIGTSLPFEVTTLPQPAAPSISVNGSPVICGNEFKTLTAQSSEPVTGYEWNNGSTSSSINIINAGTYSVRTKGSYGCWSSYASISIAAGAVPAGSITTNGPASFCEGDSIQLTITTGNNNSVLWSNGSTSRSIWVKNAGSFSAQITSPEGCSSMTNSVVVTVNPKPSPVITQNQNVLTVHPASGSYQWFLNGSPIAGATGQSYTIPAGGDYSVQVTSANGCTAVASISAVIRMLTAFIDYQVYPNPVINNINIIYNLKEAGTVSISLIHEGGQVVHTVISGQQQVPGEFRFTIPDAGNRFQSGIYLIRIQVGDKTVTQRIVII